MRAQHEGKCAVGEHSFGWQGQPDILTVTANIDCGYHAWTTDHCSIELLLFLRVRLVPELMNRLAALDESGFRLSVCGSFT